MKVYLQERVIRFKFDKDDWRRQRANLFIAELKLMVPPQERRYDELTNWWTVGAQWEPEITALRLRIFGQAATQLPLFASAAA